MRLITNPNEQLDYVLKALRIPYNERLNLKLSVEEVTAEEAKRTGVRNSSNPEGLLHFLDCFAHIATYYKVHVKMLSIPTILDHLLKDGFVASSKFPNTNTTGYKITFSGLIWIENGGYCGKADRDSLEANKSEESRKQLYRLTVLASVGTFGGLIIQTLQHFGVNYKNSLFLLYPFWIITLFFLIRFLFQKLDQ